MLDRFAGINTASPLGRELTLDLRERLRTRKNLNTAHLGENIRMAYALWREAREELDRLSGEEQERLRMADLWIFQRGEIQDAALAGPDEDTTLEAEKRVLANAERLYAAAMGAHESLHPTDAALLLPAGP